MYLQLYNIKLKNNLLSKLTQQRITFYNTLIHRADIKNPKMQKKKKTYKIK